MTQPETYEILAAKKDALELEGCEVEFDPITAEQMGAFEEDALSEEEAKEAVND